MLKIISMVLIPVIALMLVTAWLSPNSDPLEAFEAQLHHVAQRNPGITAIGVHYDRNAKIAIPATAALAPIEMLQHWEYRRETMPRVVKGIPKEYVGELRIQVHVEAGLTAREAEDLVFSAFSFLKRFKLTPALEQAAFYIDILDPEGRYLSKVVSHSVGNILVWRSQESQFTRYSLYIEDWVWITHHWMGWVTGNAQFIYGWSPLPGQDPSWTDIGIVHAVRSGSQEYTQIGPK